MTRRLGRALPGSLIAAGCLALLGGCAEELTRQPPPGARVTVLFDPAARDAEGNAAPVLPTPTDFARDAQTGLLAIPDGPADTAAQRELNAYLRGLDGYPVRSSAEVRFSGALSAASTAAEQLAKAIVVVSLPTDGAAVPERIAPAALRFAYEAEAAGTSRVTIAHEGGWARGARYALFLDGAALAGAVGEPVIRAVAFELVASQHPICALDGGGRCTFNHSSLLHAEVDRAVRDDPANADKTTEELVPLVRAAELEAATRLEALRGAIDGLLTVAQGVGLSRDAVAVAWSFSTSSQVEALFDPSAGAMPLPANDLLLARQDDAAKGCKQGRVCLPPVAGESAADEALRRGLNQLDGFSTNGALWTRFSGPLERSTINAESVRVINTLTLQPHAVALRFDDEQGALIITPSVPFAEKTRYAVVLTSKAAPGTLRAAAGLADRAGQRVVASPIFALARLGEPLVKDGTAQVRGVDYATAVALEELRAQWASLFAAAPAFGLAREDVVLAWTFVTQSLTAPLVALRALPWQRFGDAGSPLGDGGKPSLAGELVSDKAELVAKAGLSAEQAALFGGALADGAFVSYDALDPATGTLWPPDQVAAAGRAAQVPLLLLLPEASAGPGGARPAAGWPVVYFHHGLGRSKADALALAAACVARGFAVLANDAPFHGARTLCTKNEHCTEQGICDPATGRCSTALADANSDGVPDASGGIGPGAAYLNTNNPLVLRDNLRQSVIDAAALLRVVQLGGADRLSGVTDADRPLLDGQRVALVGHSLGGIVGTLLLATDGAPQRGVLSAPGGPWIDGVAMQSALLSPYITELGKARGVAAGSLDELRLLVTFQWILDAADAVSFAPFVQAGGLPDAVRGGVVGKKQVVVQKAALDRTMPPGATQRLADLLGADTAKTTFAGQDHGFLLHPSPDAKATAAAQEQAVRFVDTGELCTPRLVDGTCTVP